MLKASMAKANGRLACIHISGGLIFTLLNFTYSVFIFFVKIKKIQILDAKLPLFVIIKFTFRWK